MKKILVINGPNLNLLGIREKEIYGEENYASLVKKVKAYAKEKQIKVKVVQSNCEGKIIDFIQKSLNKVDGIIINPGAYAHYSYAIRDAIKAVDASAIEVHISDVFNRDDFRKNLVFSEVCKKTIVGHGINGYFEAIDEFLK